MYERLIRIERLYTYTGMNNLFGDSGTDNNTAELVISRIAY
jgi:hypothetical protein